MSKIEAMRKILSGAARDSLAAQAGEYPGFVVQVNTSRPEVHAALLAELRAHGVIGPNDGLTVLGSGLVAKLRAELLDSLF